MKINHRKPINRIGMIDKISSLIFIGFINRWKSILAIQVLLIVSVLMDFKDFYQLWERWTPVYEVLLYSFRARSIQPKFRPVRPGKEDHLKRWTSFFETFPVGPNRSTEFWTEISGNFGWMDRALRVGTLKKRCSTNPPHKGLFRGRCPRIASFKWSDFSKRVFNTLSIIFFVFSTHLEEKQLLNDRSPFRKWKITTGNTFNF